MLVRVTLETTAHHKAADDERLSGLRITTIHGYRSMLARIYGFEAPIEAALARIPTLEPAFRAERAKVSLLEQDLGTLGFDGDAIASLPRLASVNLRTLPQALGWLFVIERQTLLAGQLRRHLQRTLGPIAELASRYLSAYGDTPGARFRVLGDALGEAAKVYSAASIVAAANEAFRAQRQWIRTCPAIGEPGTDRRASEASLQHAG